MTSYHFKYFIFYIEKEEIDRISRGEEFSHKLGWKKTSNQTFHGKAYRQEISGDWHLCHQESSSHPRIFELRVGKATKHGISYSE